MRLAVVASLVIGCGARPVPYEHAPEPDRDATRSGAFELPLDDAQAVARWRALAPTFGTWGTVRRQIPEPLRKPLARAVLRGGNFACPRRLRRPEGCPRAAPELDRPDDAAGFDDPCMRRLLATWALRVLADRELVALPDAMVELAGLPAPEHDLNLGVLGRVTRTAPERALPLYLAAHRAGALGAELLYVDELPAADQRTAMAAGLYRKTPAEVDPIRDRDGLLAKMRDPALDPDHRARALEKLTATVPRDQPLPKDLRLTLTALALERDCELAMAAAATLAAHGEPSYLPRRPTTPAVADHLRVLCLIGAASQPHFDDQTAADHALAVLASYHAPGPRTLRIAWHDKLDDYDRAYPLEGFDRRIAAAFRNCTGTRCDNGFDVVDVTFSPAPDGGLYLRHVQIYAGMSACRDTPGRGGYTPAFADQDFDDADHHGTPLFDIFGPRQGP